MDCQLLDACPYSQKCVTKKMAEFCGYHQNYMENEEISKKTSAEESTIRMDLGDTKIIPPNEMNFFDPFNPYKEG